MPEIFTSLHAAAAALPLVLPAAALSLALASVLRAQASVLPTAPKSPEA